MEYPVKITLPMTEEMKEVLDKHVYDLRTAKVELIRMAIKEKYKE